MNNLQSGFVTELVAGFHPMVKRATAPSAEDLAGRIGSGAGQFARGALITGAIGKMLQPDVPMGEALRGGAALTGGGMLGSAAARKLKLGPLAGGGMSLLGSALAIKALRSLEKDKRKERAREEMFGKESHVKSANIMATLSKVLRSGKASLTGRGLHKKR